MSFTAYQWASSAAITAPVSPTAKHLLRVLADFADKDGYCFPSISTLMEHLGRSRRTVQRALTALVEANLVTREQRRRRFGSFTSNGYWLAVDKKNSPGEKPPGAKSTYHKTSCHKSITGPVISATLNTTSVTHVTKVAHGYDSTTSPIENKTSNTSNVARVTKVAHGGRSPVAHGVFIKNLTSHGLTNPPNPPQERRKGGEGFSKEDIELVLDCLPAPWSDFEDVASYQKIAKRLRSLLERGLTKKQIQEEAASWSTRGMRSKIAIVLYRLKSLVNPGTESASVSGLVELREQVRLSLKEKQSQQKLADYTLRQLKVYHPDTYQLLEARQLEEQIAPALSIQALQATNYRLDQAKSWIFDWLYSRKTDLLQALVGLVESNCQGVANG